jgi:hypothetical protein
VDWPGIPIRPVAPKKKDDRAERIFENPTLDNAPEDAKKVAPLLTQALVAIEPEKDSLVVALYSQAVRLLEYAEKLEITKTEDIRAVTNDLTIIGKLKKAFEDKRKEYVSPLNGHVAAINATFKELTDPIKTADDITRKKLVAFHLAEKRKKEETERINAFRREAAEAEAAMNEGEITESVVELPVDDLPSKTTQSDLGTVTMVDVWKYEVVDLALLPREYMVPDEAMLKSIAKTHHDKKEIPGVRFYNEPTTSVRSK